ncbi:MAG: signal peptidase I, partial [Rhodospirillaceae bacterium]|nr:signal peptidase I [Rhodospirillaceae bacterium]
IQVRSGRLHINGKQVRRDGPLTRTDISGGHALKAYDGLTGRECTSHSGLPAPAKLYREILPSGRSYTIYECSDHVPGSDNTGVYTVPAGHYFMMGDNRDNSSDSRFSGVGMVPLRNFIGRAQFLFFSVNGSASIWEVWKWPGSIRWSRLFQGIN